MTDPIIMPIDLMRPDLPDEIMAWHAEYPLTWSGTWAITRYPSYSVAYVRKSIFEDMMAELDEARRLIDAMIAARDEK